MTHRTLRQILMAGAVAFSGACIAPDASQAPGEELDEIALVRQEIKGGQTDSSNPSIMGLVSLGGGGLGICTGTLIAPNLVLTAQHCVSSDVPEYINCGAAEFGRATNASSLYFTPDTYMSQNGEFYIGEALFLPPGGNDVCGFDIALVMLKNNVPASVAEPVVPRIDIPVRAGESYTAIGYGNTGGSSGSGTRRILEGLEAVCNGSDCPSYYRIDDTEFFGDSGTCQGDSGGPAIDSYGRVLGALSRGAAGCQSSIYSGVHGWSDWIREVGAAAAADGSYEPARWVTEGTSDEAVDRDLDGVNNLDDNCPRDSNPDQLDFDGDNIGDVCDPDLDGDNVADDIDNCPGLENSEQADLDLNGIGDACDDDVDGDGFLDEDDNCPQNSNPFQSDIDNDLIGNACDEDDDNDATVDTLDNCPSVFNPAQFDEDDNGIGDACEEGVEGSGFISAASSAGNGSCSLMAGHSPDHERSPWIFGTILLALFGFARFRR